MEGRLYLEFMFDDMMRIKTWHFSIRQHREVVPRSILAMHVSLGYLFVLFSVHIITVLASLHYIEIIRTILLS